jgi:NADH-quinone oxidoreductase subunit N
LPEIVLIAAATAIYLGGTFVQGRLLWSWAAMAGIGLAAMFLWRGEIKVPAGLLAGDLLAQYGRWLALVTGGLLVMMSTKGSSPGFAAEAKASLVLAVAGLMLVAASDDLVLTFLGLELITIPTYVLLYLGREGLEAKEASAKYFYLSVLSSAVMLYGFAFVYGMGGSTHLPRVQAVLAGQEPAIGHLARFAPMAIVLLFAGLGFKMAAAPFQFYAPDVYQGTSHANAALLSVLPKAAGLIALLRIVGYALPGQEAIGWRLAMIVGVLSMTVGNVVALWQTNLRRLLAYSSIAHVGYMMIGLAAGFALVSEGQPSGIDGFGAMLFYLSVYAIATIGTFAAFTFLGRREQPLETIDDLAGLARTYPLVGVAMAIFMFSLAGVPPLAGFLGKLTLFYSAIDVSASPAGESVRIWFVALALVGVLNAAIAAAYYLRIVGAVFFRPSVEPLPGEGGWGAWSSAIVAAALVLAVGLMPKPLLREAKDAGRMRTVAPASATATAEAAVERLTAR